MRVMIVDLYKWLYIKTRSKWFSIWGAVSYITLLNLITIQGLGALMEIWISAMSVITRLFRSPAVVILALIVLFINYWLITPLKNLKKERQKQPYIIPVLVYTGVCVILVCYSVYGSTLM